MKKGRIQDSPDLSRFQKGASSEERLHLSLRLSNIGQSSQQPEQHDAQVHHIRQIRTEPGSSKSMRTKEFKELKEKVS